MDIDCLLSEEPVDKLIVEFIEMEIQKADDSKTKERNRKEIKVLNSLLVALSSSKQGLKLLLTEINYWIEVSQNQKTRLGRVAQLMYEAIKRSQHLLLKASPQTVEQIVKLAQLNAFSAVSGNQFIALLQIIASKIDLIQHRAITMIFLELLVSPKLLTATYRRETRQYLYKLYLRILSIYKEFSQNEAGSQKQAFFIEKCINAGNNEKDPRNIGFVFQIYLKVFQLFPANKLQQYQSSIFQSLQAYYPIEFVGDEDQNKTKQIDLKQISGLLDECICHSLFKQQAWQLFMSKTAAPPIAPFVSTMLVYLSNRKKDTPASELMGNLRNMLVRLSDDEFIGQQYEKDTPDLGELCAAIFNIIFCNDDGGFSVQGYDIVLKWLEIMVGKVINGQCKYGGSLMSLFRSIVKKGNHPRFKTLVELFRNFTLRKILNSLNDETGIIPRLGLTIVALQNLEGIGSELKEVIALLVLQVGKLYPEVTDQIKMLLLKILLYVFRGGAQNRVMVRNVNDNFILKDILSRAQWAFKNSLESAQIYMVKAFIEFVAVVYTNKYQQILNNIEGDSIQLESYLLARMMESVLSESDSAQKRKALVDKFSLLVSKVKVKEDKEGLLRSLKAVSLSTSIYYMGRISWNQSKESSILYISLIIELKKHFRNKTEQEDELGSIVQKYQQQISNELIIAYLSSQNASMSKKNSTILQSLTEELCQQKKIYFPSLKEINQSKLEEFVFQQSFVEGYQPTLIHWIWQHLQRIQQPQQKTTLTSQLIQNLPEKILLRDSKLILSVLVQSQHNTLSLLKIVKNLQFESLKQTGIVNFCLRQVQQMCKESQQIIRSTERTTCILAVLIDMLEKDHDGFLKGVLSKMKKELERLLQSRKRPVRQAVRRILFLMQQ